jgi:predicted nucleic acid-binding protein
MLVDTSVWVDHFRWRNARLVLALEASQVLTHPFVTGELSCGNLARRGEIMNLLQALPALTAADHAEVLAFVDAHALFGRGLGWVDMHLLAAAALARVPLWTLDKRLAAAALEIGLAAAV